MSVPQMQFQQPSATDTTNLPPAPPLETRQPTGLPSWPVGLVAGVEKSGKTIELVKASASPLVHRTFWIGLGEDDPDEYGAFEGANFEIVVHDGTYRGVLSAVQAAVAQHPGPDGRPNLIVFDSLGRLWALLSNMAQQTMNERALKRNPNAAIPDDGLRPTPDLWNQANDRWDTLLDTLKSHQGPVLLTSRLDLQMVVDGAGNPTKEKTWKIAAQKNLSYDVGFVVQMRASYPERDNYLTGVRSLRYKHETDRKGKAVLTALPEDFSIDAIWRSLGVDDKVSARTGSRMTAYGDEFTARRRTELLEQIKEAADGVRSLEDMRAGWADKHNGEQIHETLDFDGLERLLAWLRAQTPAQGARTQAPDQSAQDAPERAQEPVAERAPEPTPERAPERAPEPVLDHSQPAGRAPEPGLSNQQKLMVLATDELRYQADVLDVHFEEYVRHLRIDPTDETSEFSTAKVPTFNIGQRAQVIAVLRDTQRLTEAANLERLGAAPFINIERNVLGEGFERVPEPAHA